MWTLEQKKEYLLLVRFGEASSIVMASISMASAFLAVGIFVGSSIWRGFVTFDGVSFFSGRNKSRLFFTGVLFIFWGSMASKFDDADRLTDDKRTVFTLRAFSYCHDVDWLIAKRLPTFAILIRYLRGRLEATEENVMTLCDVVDYLRTYHDMSISTSILHVEGNSGAFRMGGNGCGFEFCSVCNSSPVPQKEDEKGRPNIKGWLFATEEWLVQGLIEKILEEVEPSWLGELLRGGGSKAQSPHFWQARQVAIKNTQVMATAASEEERAHWVSRVFNATTVSEEERARWVRRVFTPAECPHTIEAPRFKVTIKGGVVTDVWHRDDQRRVRVPMMFRCPQRQCFEGGPTCDKGVQTDEVVTVTHVQ